MALCFWMSDVIFTPRQASFQMISCLEDTQFLWDEYFAFSRYPMKKQIVPTDAAHFLGQKQQKSKNHKKLTCTKNMWQQWYPRQYIDRSLQRWLSNIVTCQSGLPISLFTFCSQLIEPVRTMACVVWLSPLKTVQLVQQANQPLCLLAHAPDFFGPENSSMFFC